MAKNYIYRNLHAGKAFSVRYRGKVVQRLTEFVALGVTFKVNELGRLRVIEERQKNVHAFVVAESIIQTQFSIADLQKVSYNPYTMSSFTINGVPIREAQGVVFSNGHCYLLPYDCTQNLWPKRTGP